jgi:hypothetical protein
VVKVVKGVVLIEHRDGYDIFVELSGKILVQLNGFRAFLLCVGDGVKLREFDEFLNLVQDGCLFVLGDIPWGGFLFSTWLGCTSP